MTARQGRTSSLRSGRPTLTRSAPSGRGRRRPLWHTGGVTHDDLLERVMIDPTICHGQPCIRGTRVLVTVVLDALAAGLSTPEILEHYPTLQPEDVRAAAAYGASLAKQEVHALTHGR